ncbi:MAG: hypothetical protein ACXVLQ_04925 [Bacteriovorax sp.]
MTLFQKKYLISLMVFFVLSSFNTSHVFANDNSDEGMKGKVTKTAKDVKTGTKKSVRKLQDKTCEVINGKTKCLPKKVKHSIENEMDTAKDATDATN